MKNILNLESLHLDIHQKENYLSKITNWNDGISIKYLAQIFVEIWSEYFVW